MFFFTADHHFCHENIIKYSNRPFESLEDMHEQLISRWNAAVSPRDTVFHLGDFAFTRGKRHRDLVNDILYNLNGKKVLIAGNHDKKDVLGSKHWLDVLPYHELKVDFGEVHLQRIVLCHYALRTWNQMHRGAFMLHGHSHGSLSDIGGKTMDVGVDCNNFTPISILEVNAFMASREIVSYDHHIGE